MTESNRVRLLRYMNDNYPIENEVIRQLIFFDDSSKYNDAMTELKDLGYIDNGTSVHYHWLTEDGKRLINDVK